MADCNLELKVFPLTSPPWQTVTGTERPSLDLPTMVDGNVKLKVLPLTTPQWRTVTGTESQVNLSSPSCFCQSISSQQQKLGHPLNEISQVPQVPPSPPHWGSCLEALTTHELIRSISTVGEGVTLLLDEDALAAGAPELIGQTDSCEGERGHAQRSWRAAAVPGPNQR